MVWIHSKRFPSELLKSCMLVVLDLSRLNKLNDNIYVCLLYTSDAADDLLCLLYKDEFMGVVVRGS